MQINQTGLYQQGVLDARKQHDETIAAMAADRQAQQENWRGFLMNHMTDKLDAMKEKGATAEQQRELTQFSTLQNQLSLSTGNQKQAIQTQLNKILEGTSNPILKAFPPYTEDVPVPGTGVNLGPLGNWGTTKTKVPVGMDSQQVPSTVIKNGKTYKVKIVNGVPMVDPNSGQ